MSKKGEELKELCRKYVKGQIDTIRYTDLFNEYYLLYEDEMDDNELALFDNIYIANELYNSEDALRNENYVSTGEKELRNTIVQSLEK